MNDIIKCSSCKCKRPVADFTRGERTFKTCTPCHAKRAVVPVVQPPAEEKPLVNEILADDVVEEPVALVDDKYLPKHKLELDFHEQLLQQRDSNVDGDNRVASVDTAPRRAPKDLLSFDDQTMSLDSMVRSIADEHRRVGPPSEPVRREPRPRADAPRASPGAGNMRYIAAALSVGMGLFLLNRTTAAATGQLQGVDYAATNSGFGF